MSNRGRQMPWLAVDEEDGWVAANEKCVIGVQLVRQRSSVGRVRRSSRSELQFHLPICLLCHAIESCNMYTDTYHTIHSFID
jgi:hypothetical protein